MKGAWTAKRVAMFHYQYRGYDIGGDFYSWSSRHPARVCSRRQSWVIHRLVRPGGIWVTLPGRHRTLAQAKAEVDRILAEQLTGMGDQKEGEA